jgi:hypothetical protein
LKPTIERTPRSAARPAARHHLGLLDGVRERLLAQNVLAGLERGDGDLRVRVARRADVDKVHVVAAQEHPPVRLDRAPAQPLGGGPGGVRRAAAEGGHVDVVGQVEEAPRGAPRLGVRGAHEGVADHADA